MRIAMLLWNPCISDSRVMKEATSLARLGHEVTVFCLKARGIAEEELKGGVVYRRMAAWNPWAARQTSRRSGFGGAFKNNEALRGIGTLAQYVGMVRSWAVGGLRRIGGRAIGPYIKHWVVLRTFRDAVVSFGPEVVHAHDLITLPAAIRLARRCGSAVVYDSHELALHVSNPPKGLRWLVEQGLEWYCIRRAHAVITVSRGIAAYLRKVYRIRRVTVVLNAPVTSGAAGWHEDVRAQAKIPEDAPCVVFVGGLARGRGLATLVKSMTYLRDAVLVFIGPRSPEREKELVALARAVGVGDRLRFLDPVPPEAVVQHLRTADVSVIPYENICLNHELCMPNKLFESILAGVPVAVANLKSMKKVVRHECIGTVFNERDARSIAGAIQRVLAGGVRLRPQADLLRLLREKYGWERQAEKLARVYAELGGAWTRVSG